MRPRADAKVLKELQHGSVRNVREPFVAVDVLKRQKGPEHIPHLFLIGVAERHETEPWIEVRGMEAPQPLGLRVDDAETLRSGELLFRHCL